MRGKGTYFTILKTVRKTQLLCAAAEQGMCTASSMSTMGTSASTPPPRCASQLQRNHDAVKKTTAMAGILHLRIPGSVPGRNPKKTRFLNHGFEMRSWFWTPRRWESESEVVRPEAMVRARPSISQVRAQLRSVSAKASRAIRSYGAPVSGGTRSTIAPHGAVLKHVLHQAFDGA